MNMPEATRWNTAKDQLVTDFRAVITDTEELLRATAGEAGDKASAARTKIESRLHEAKLHLRNIEETVVTKAKHAAKATDEMVHEHPWKAVGVAASVGFLLGMLARRH